MFKANSNSDRLDYGKLLMPPEGYTLESAVGTTYSLDLETLTAVAISLGLAEEPDSELRNNPIALLNALQKVSDRILIFSEAGQMKRPSSESPLFLLLEKMVVPVALPLDRKMNGYPSFHPKMWILVYQNKDGNRLYRLVVLSRNLTFDRSWDVSAALDGEKAGAEVESSLPLRDFLYYLRDQIKSDFEGARSKRKRLKELAEEIAGVRFSANDKRFSDFQFLPLGIGEKQHDMTQDPLWKDTFHELLVMSPFLSEGVIEHFNEENMGLTDCRRTLITRREELCKLEEASADRFTIYVLKDEICDGESDLPEGTDEPQRQDIHAKLYIRKKYAGVDLYLGSMNASCAAMNHNVEFLIRLHTKNHYLNTELFLKDIFGDEKENPFEKVDSWEPRSQEEGSDETDKLERQIKELCRAGGKAEVLAAGDNYRIRLRFPEKEWKYPMTVSPFRSKKSAPMGSEILFEDLDALQVSEFYLVSAEGAENTLERIIMIPTANLPGDRDTKVVQSIVKDKKSFMDYVLFVLGDNPLVSVMEAGKRTGSADYHQTFPAVYEKMLKAAAEAPEKLADINQLLSMIKDENIVSDEFRETYQLFRRTCRLK